MNNINLLRQTLKPHLKWHGARLSFLALFLIVLFRVKTVNLAELSTGFMRKAKTESNAAHSRHRLRSRLERIRVCNDYSDQNRASTESPYDLRRHKDAISYTLMAAFCIQRSQEITDNLIELLNQIIHRIDTRAIRRINKELIDEFKTVSGKTGLLFRIAEAAIASPNGVVEQVIYPVVSLIPILHEDALN